MLIDDRDKRIARGEEKANDIIEGYEHGLRGKHGNAIFMLYQSRREIAELTKGNV